MKKTMIAVLCLILVASTLTGCRRGSGTTTVPTTGAMPATSGTAPATTRATTAPTEMTRDTTGATENRDHTGATENRNNTETGTTGTNPTGGSPRTRSGSRGRTESTTTPTRGAVRGTLPGALG